MGRSSTVTAEVTPSGKVGSASRPATLAVSRTCPTAVGVTTSVIVRLAPGASAPRLQLSVFVPPQLPWLAPTHPNDNVAGNVSVSTIPVACDGPALLICQV